MNLKGKISIFINREHTTIEVEDPEANTVFLRIKLTPEQLSSALSRIAHTDCELHIVGLDKVGKVHENKVFEFEVKGIEANSINSDKLHEYAQSLLTDGWVPDNYFASQNTFFTKDGKQYARCTIRRWIDKQK